MGRRARTAAIIPPEFTETDGTVLGISITHGECDAGNAGYENDLYQLWSDYNTALPAWSAGKGFEVAGLGTETSRSTR